MDFYSTYYKRQASYDQIQELTEKFGNLDINGDKALNKNELANIFDAQDLTEEEKSMLMAGVDNNNDGFLTFEEFTPAFIEFDVDMNSDISGEEYAFVKKKMEESQIQTQINDQFAILNNITSTASEKEVAQDQIEILKGQRNIMYLELDVDRKTIEISGKDVKINEITTFISDNTLLEFDEAQQLKKIEELEVEKELLLLDKNISLAKLNKENLELTMTEKQIQLKTETDPDVTEQLSVELLAHGTEMQGLERLVLKAENELQLHHKQVRIEENENLLTKFFVPDFLKEKAREELDTLRDEYQRLELCNDLQDKVFAYATTGAELILKIYENEHSDDPSVQEEVDALNEELEYTELEANIANLRVLLKEKQMQLKGVIPKADHSPYNKLKEQLEGEITDIETEIINLELEL